MKVIKHTLISSALTFSLISASPTAEAAYGVATALSGGVGAGIGYYLLGGFISLPSTVMIMATSAENSHSNRPLLWSLIAAIGLVILDKESENIQLRPISINEPLAKILNANELRAYNQDLNRINALMTESISMIANSKDKYSALVLKTFNKNIELFSALKDSIFLGKHTLSMLTPTFNEKKDDLNDQDVEIIILRTIPTEAPDFAIKPVVIILNERVVGFFPKGIAGETQFAALKLNVEVHTEEQTLILDSGLMGIRRKEDVILGELSIIKPLDNCHLIGEKNSKGEILGITKNYYKIYCRS